MIPGAPRRVLALLLLLLALATALYFGLYSPGKDAPQAVIALLVPDDAAAGDPLISIWMDAAREEGIRMETVSVSTFLRPSLAWAAHDYAGIVMPDTVHKSANSVLLLRLEDHVRAGGHLMLVYDAATKTPAGVYYPQHAPLSKLLGVEYALYDTLLDQTTELGPVWAGHATIHELGIPPGKTLPFTGTPAGSAGNDPEAIAGYQYGILRYPSYVTRGAFPGKRLLSTGTGGLAAGYREAGKGGVLFVNLPLGYLKGQTDGLPLHTFLRYFAETILSLPTLSASPQGVGGLVFNWHIDSNAALASLEELDKYGVLSQGPFSIHFTAGPDARQFGDGLGMNLAHNAGMQKWLQRFKERGDALGNHGGWIHDYFGLNVLENNRAEMERFLVLNNQVMEAASGEKMREYSAPVGTQPKWVTQWLESNGFVAYYFIGNTGMAPTRSYREGKLFTQKIWSFPVVTFGKVASFEEADRENIPDREVANWLIQISDFAADNATIRTFYSHPTGWYTMSQIADFLNRREQASWHLALKGDSMIVEASHPSDLDQLSWKFPKPRFEKPVIETGSGKVIEHEKYWQVVAGPGNVMRISSRTLPFGK